MPKIIEFLGMNPLPKPATFAELLVFYRTCHGFAKKRWQLSLASIRALLGGGRLAVSRRRPESVKLRG